MKRSTTNEAVYKFAEFHMKYIFKKKKFCVRYLQTTR